MLRIKLRNTTIDRCVTGIKSEGPILIDADGLHITNTKTAFDLSTPEDSSLGNSNGERGDKPRRRDDIANNVIATLVSAAVLSAVGILWNLT